MSSASQQLRTTGHEPCVRELTSEEIFKVLIDLVNTGDSEAKIVLENFLALGIFGIVN